MIEMLTNHLFNKFNLVVQRVVYMSVTQCTVTVCDLETGRYFDLYIRYDMTLETINKVAKCGKEGVNYVEDWN